MELINTAGPGLVAVGVLGLPLAAAARWGWRSVWAGGLHLLGVALLAVWTAKSVVIADSSYGNPPAWPALPWMLAAVSAAGLSIMALRMRGKRMPTSRTAATRSLDPR